MNMQSSGKGISTQTWLYLFAVYIIWGSTYLGMKIATATVPAFYLSAMRFFLAGIVLLAIGIYREKTMPTLRQALSASFVGILLIGTGNTTVALAVHYMPSGLVALLVAAMPAWFMGLDWAFFSKNRPSTTTMLGIAVGFVGLFLLFNPFRQENVQAFPLWPVLIVILGNICWATGSLMVPRLPMPTQITSTAIQMLAGGVFALMVSAITENNATTSFLEMPHSGWVAYCYLVFIGSLVGYTSYSWLTRNAPPKLTATYAYINPIVALFLGWAIGNESITAMVIVAATIVIGGVVLMTVGKK